MLYGWSRTFALAAGAGVGAWIGSKHGKLGAAVGAGAGVIGTALIIHFLKM